MTAFAGTISNRDDLIVCVAPGAGHGSPGCFLPSFATIELDADVTFPGRSPWRIDAGDPGDHLQHPAAYGVLRHELAHATHSAWSPQSQWGPAVHQLAMLLEEPRAEHARLRRHPHDREWLRAAVRTIIAPSMANPPGFPKELVEAAVRTAILVVARADAGVLDWSETAPVRLALRKIFTRSQLCRLRRIWRAALHVADADGTGIYRLARRVQRFIDQVRPPQSTDVPGLAKALSKATSRATRNLGKRLKALAAPSTTGTRGGTSRQSTPRAEQVFAKAWPIQGSRPPRADEQRAARALAAALQRAAVRERTQTVTPSALPPGRLRMRGAVAAAAQRAAGARSTAQPWQRIQRHYPPDPIPRLGIAVDVSASMSSWCAPAASAAWICSHAAAHVNGKVAAATFGSRVTALIYPQQPPANVPVLSLELSTSYLEIAIDALDTALDLSGNGDARLLILITDGELSPISTHEVDNRIRRLRDTGCAVLQLGPAHDTTPLPGALLVRLDDPATAITTITAATLQALRAADGRA